SVEGARGNSTQRCANLPRRYKDKLMRRATLALVAMLLAVAFAAAQPASTTRFRNITQSAGIRFQHNNGAFGQKWLPETLGPGCAFIDYDNDGYPDILLVNGADFAGHAAKGATTAR